MNQAVKNSHSQPFYLRDNFAPVFEELTDTQLKPPVSG